MKKKNIFIQLLIYFPGPFGRVVTTASAASIELYQTECIQTGFTALALGSSFSLPPYPHKIIRSWWSNKLWLHRLRLLYATVVELELGEAPPKEVLPRLAKRF
jgi:hypothetical protein